MRDGAVTVFVEVRYRRSARYGDAAASVTQKTTKTPTGCPLVALPTEWEL
jgi:Holliday junction resolvase-like predicted endonuclease